MRIVALLAMALSACTSEEQPSSNAMATADMADARAAPAAPAVKPPRLAVAGEGLRLFPQRGSATAIPFGTPRDAVMTALSFRGSAETGTMEECGPGPLDHAIWDDGLKLYFQEGKLAGWAIDERSKGAIATASEIGIGGSRTELEQVQAIEVAETSLGTEFTSGAIAGLLDGPGREAKVTDLWAGLTCIFR